MKKLILTFRNLANVIKKKGQKKKTRKEITSNMCSVSWYGHHHTYRFTILEQNTLLYQKLIHVSWNDHCFLIFSRHWICEFAFFFSLFKQTSPQMQVSWLHRNINETKRCNTQSFHICNYWVSVISTFPFSCVINCYLLNFSMEQKPSWEANRF